MKHLFYDQNGSEVTHPKKEHIQVTKFGEILPKYNNEGREVKGHPETKKYKAKLRKNFSIPYVDEIAKTDICRPSRLSVDPIEVDPWYKWKTLNELVENIDTNVLSDLGEIKKNYPKAAAYLEELSLRQSEKWFQAGTWMGMKYAIGEIENCPNFNSLRRAWASGQNLPKQKGPFLSPHPALFKSIFG